MLPNTWYNEGINKRALTALKAPSSPVHTNRMSVHMSIPNDTTPHKTCTSCHQSFPATTEYFYAQKNGRYGVNSRCKSCRNEYYKKYRQTAEGKGHINDAARKYYAVNPKRKMALNKKRHARLHYLDTPYTKDDVKDLYETQHGLCYWCSKPVYLRYEVEHIIPVALGGADDLSNIVIACRDCNRSKGDKLPWEWREDWYVNLDW